MFQTSLRFRLWTIGLSLSMLSAAAGVELEPVARSAYCGSVFYYSNHGRLDSSITIRSLVADGDQLHCWGGGGIVADSDAKHEYEETLSKGRALYEALLAVSQSNSASPRTKPVQGNRSKSRSAGCNDADSFS